MKMNNIEEFDFVELIVPTGNEFNDDRIGEVTRVDGCYIMVKRNISGVEIELYPHEMRLLEDEEAEMAWFQRNLWRGLKNKVNGEGDYNWLTAGYMREVDWEAAQEENVTFECIFPHPDDPDLRGSEVTTLPTKWGKFAAKLNLLNDRCQKTPEQFKAEYEGNWDRANKVVK